MSHFNVLPCSMSPPTTKILVHIAAPSEVADDAKYRALAQAYLDFEPSERRNLLGGHGNTVNQQQLTDGTSVSEKRSIKTPSVSFRSVWDNSESPCLIPIRITASESRHGKWHHPHTPSQNIPGDRHSQNTYASQTAVIPDSQSDNMSRFECGSIFRDGLGEPVVYSGGSKVLSSDENDDHEPVNYGVDCACEEAASPDLGAIRRKDDSQPYSQPQLPVPQAPPIRCTLNQPLCAEARNDAVQSKHDMLAHSWRTIPSSITEDSRKCANQRRNLSGHIPSSVPEESGEVVLETSLDDIGRDSFWATELESEPLKEDDQPTTASQITPHHSTGNRYNGGPSSGCQTFERNPSDWGPRHKKRRLDITPHLNSIMTAPAERSRSPIVGVTSKTQMIEHDVMPYLHDTSTHILSPEPPEAYDHLDITSLVTDKLAKLARDLHLTRRYKPDPPHRAVQPFERGFWRLDTSRWPEELKIQAWTYLTNYIGQGDAGWSVWCSRDRWPHTWIRLHCFAAVAGHTYLLLYLASRRQILSMETIWMDGSCTPTISVPARKWHYTGHTYS